MTAQRQAGTQRAGLYNPGQRTQVSLEVSSMPADSYARPELLAETDWLEAQLDDPDVRIIDCRMPEGYVSSHIPGAYALPVHHYLKDEGGVHIMPPEAFGRLMSGLGVDADTTVVAYDDDGGRHATRLWWALAYHGHDRARVLNGALQKWVGEGRPTTTATPPAPPARTFTPHLRPEAIATLGDVKACIHAPGALILDVRSAGEFAGTERRQNRRVGHIPGAVNIEWTRALSDGPYPVWRPAAELRQMFESVGVTPDRTIITH
jgi:thiosulfate/3-mercaptopyruvate sulfurtransferase